MRQILKIAKKVRRKIEGIHRKHGVWDDDMCGACCVGTHILLKELSKKGIKAQAGVASNHVFLIYKNKIVDVTATQFGFRKDVVVYELDRVTDYDNFWRPVHVVSDPPSLRNVWTDMGCHDHNEQHPQKWINRGLIEA
jgi:hypothetical protein